MNKLLLKCKVCQTYTLNQKCPKCGSELVASPHPPKYSPDDRYLRYRVHDRYVGKTQQSSTVLKKESEKI